MLFVKNIWKKIIFIMVFFAIILLYSKRQVSAAEYSGATENGTSTIVNAPTPNKLDTSDPAVQIPGGGYLMGEGEFTIVDSNGEETTIDPKNTSYKVTTTGQALKDLQKQSINNSEKNSKVTSRIMLPNNNTSSRTKIATSKITLKNNQGYSESLIGNGWRFASHIFSPSSGTGGYLKWTSIGDSGRVMDLDDNSHFEFQHWVMGTVLNNGVPRMFQGKIDYWATYYSYSPLPGSYYYVINQNL